jgi:hypothetical protein
MIILIMSKYCRSCGARLVIEKEIEERTGGDLSVCLECINKATSIILKKWVDDVQDFTLRQELRGRLSLLL